MIQHLQQIYKKLVVINYKLLKIIPFPSCFRFIIKTYFETVLILLMSPDNIRFCIFCINIIRFNLAPTFEDL